MKQTKIESIVERTADMTTGFIISVLVYKYIILTSEVLWQSPIMVTIVFTAISFVRGYLWRRFFNAGTHRIVHRYIERIYR